jgi:hypothetical protein
MRHLVLGMELEFGQSKILEIRRKMMEELEPMVAGDGEDIPALNEDTYDGPCNQMVESVKKQRMSCPGGIVCLLTPSRCPKNSRINSDATEANDAHADSTT